MIDNPEIAKALKISTEPEDIGDVYMVRKQSEYTPGERANVKIQGYDYLSQKLMKRSEIESDKSKFMSKVLGFAFNAPIVINDGRQFISALQMFRGVAFVVYCDKAHDQYDKVLETMVQCRKKMPLEIKADAGGEVDPNQGENVIFILTTSPDLLYYKFEEPEKGPQAIVMPIGNSIDTFEKYLPKLKVLDGLKLKDWLEKAQDIHNTIEAMKPSDDSDGQSDENKREVMKSWFNKDRFTIETKYYTANTKRLLNPNRMKAFIEEC